MITGIWKIFRMFRGSFAGGDTPRQIGFGVAMGMLIGIVPKDSLFTYVFGVLLLMSTANLLSALVSGFVFTWMGFLLDPLSHALGKVVLTNANWQATWCALYEMPIVPWTKFNNTVVTGSLLIGLALFIPVYWGATKTFKTYGPRINSKLGQYSTYRWLAGREHFNQPAEPAMNKTLTQTEVV